jgi:two-component system, OmpR family, phosphate regulon sensor histidine kinase PhoR
VTQRVFALLAWVLFGGFWATIFFESQVAVVIACLVGAMVWGLIDSSRAGKVLDWLRSPAGKAAPEVGSIWEELTDRTRKHFKALNRKARKNEARLQEFLSAIQASPNGVILLNKTHGIEWCNFTSSQHLGFDAKRDVGQQIRNLVRDPVFIAYLNASDYAKPIEIDGRDAMPGHPHRISIHLHSYGKGRKLMLTQDVTAIEQAEAMRTDFVANVSHEIRTPLTVVSGFIETLQSLELNDAERKKYLSLMGQQAQRMLSLVNDLLTLSRLEGSPIPGASEWIDSDALIVPLLEEAKALSKVIAEQEHQILQEPSPSFEVAGAKTELMSAMSNLLSNAVRHTPGGSCIRTGWRLLDDGEVGFYVADNGPGIAPEHLPRLTERFYRVDRSRSRETGGTGLGLAIVKHVAQRHGGTMTVTSEQGVGSEFMIVLPPSRVLMQDE